MSKFKFTLGFIAGAMVFGTIGVAAAASTKTIGVIFGIEDIKINNVSKMPKQEPFTYNGTTYVPLRYISDNLGAEVGWDAKTQIITINSKQTTCTTNSEFDASNYIGTWRTEVGKIDVDKKIKTEIETGFDLEVIGSNTIQLSNSYRDVATFDLRNGKEEWLGTTQRDWETNEFKVNSNGIVETTLHFISDDVTYKVKIELIDGKVVITILDPKTNEKFYNSFIRDAATTYLKIR